MLAISTATLAGAIVAQRCLDRRLPVRVIVKEEAEQTPWRAMGAEVARADLEDGWALTAALSGADAAFLMAPAPAPSATGIAHNSHAIAEAIAEGALETGLPRLVFGSMIGAHVRGRTGLPRLSGFAEEVLGAARVKVTFLRVAFPIESWALLSTSSISGGSLPSFLSPLQRRLPMVGVEDVAAAAFRCLTDQSSALRVIELAGPVDYSPEDVAIGLSSVLHRSVATEQLSIAELPGRLSRLGYSPECAQLHCETFEAFNSGAARWENWRTTFVRGVIPIARAVGFILGGRTSTRKAAAHSMRHT